MSGSGSIMITAVFEVPAGTKLPNPAFDPEGVHSGIPPGQANILLDFTHNTLPQRNAPLDTRSQSAISNRILLGSILLAASAFADQEFRVVVAGLTPDNSGGRNVETPDHDKCKQ